jgi:hypothetical protein
MLISIFLSLHAVAAPDINAHAVNIANICLGAMRSSEGQEYLGRNWYERSDFSIQDLARIRRTTSSKKRGH